MYTTLYPINSPTAYEESKETVAKQDGVSTVLEQLLIVHDTMVHAMVDTMADTMVQSEPFGPKRAVLYPTLSLIHI